ncbi:5313_t:CDS:2 [Ambispora leptoticha]|uniref:5313_t:CDS:1 n=1 Tax=Ambispora leptoticha TaxID=144679 RepID=A0A9N9F331_9GLOM|nr:5313_t:CDS:2 [Ambispora leptoticha]
MPSETSLTTQTQREKRENCWRLRDAYFTCLDFAEASTANNVGSENVKNSNLDKKQNKNVIDSRECTQKKKEYEEACPSSWIVYFNKRRELEKQQRIRVVAAKELELSSGISESEISAG